MNSNNHNSNCDFSAEIVSYIYDEIGTAERAKFEVHLPGCAFCTEELAGLSEARFSVYEWRKQEFAPLQTPEIIIPYETTETASEPWPPSVSWLDGLRRLLSGSPVWATAGTGLAALVIFAGLALLFVDFSSSKDELADKGNLNAVSPTVQKTGVNGSSEANKPVEVTSSKPLDDKDSAQSPEVVKVSDVPSPAPKTKTKQAAENDTRNTKDKNAPVQKQQAPSLSNFDEDEDTTLRLADMFEEIDTKD